MKSQYESISKDFLFVFGGFFHLYFVFTGIRSELY